MLGAGQRMRRRDEFTSALRAGRRARRGDLVVHLYHESSRTSVTAAASSDHRSGSNGARAGFIIPRPVGTAVVRNTVRRRLRHLLRDRLPALPAGSLLVIRVLPGAGERTFADLARDLDAALAAVTSEAAHVTRQSQKSAKPKIASPASPAPAARVTR